MDLPATGEHCKSSPRKVNPSLVRGLDWQHLQEVLSLLLTMLLPLPPLLSVPTTAGSSGQRQVRQVVVLLGPTLLKREATQESLEEVPWKWLRPWKLLKVGVVPDELFAASE